jgi:hypothetical protein
MRASFIVGVVWRRLAIRSVAVWASRLVYGSRFGRIAEGELLGTLIVHDNCGSMAPATVSVKTGASDVKRTWQTYKTISRDSAGRYGMSDMLFWRSRSSMSVGQMYRSTTSTFPYAYAYDSTEAHYASAGRP